MDELRIKTTELMTKQDIEQKYDDFFGTGLWEKDYKKHIVEFAKQCIDQSEASSSNDIQNVSDLFNEFCDFVTEDLDMGVDDYDRDELFEKFNNR